MKRIVGKVLVGLAAFAALYVLAGCWLDAQGEAEPPPGATYDAIVVMGCAVRPGGAPSPALARRTRHAVALFHAGRAPRVVFTGGVGQYGPSEAAVAADLAERLGVPRAAMLLEDESTSTSENAAYARARFDDRRVLVVTDGYHAPRTARVFARHYEQVDVVGSRSAYRDARAAGALREVFAFGAYLAFGRMSADGPRFPGGTLSRSAGIVCEDPHHAHVFPLHDGRDPRLALPPGCLPRRYGRRRRGR